MRTKSTSKSLFRVENCFVLFLRFTLFLFRNFLFFPVFRNDILLIRFFFRRIYWSCSLTHDSFQDNVFLKQFFFLWVSITPFNEKPSKILLEYRFGKQKRVQKIWQKHHGTKMAVFDILQKRNLGRRLQITSVRCWNVRFFIWKFLLIKRMNYYSVRLFNYMERASHKPILGAVWKQGRIHGQWRCAGRY